MGERKTIRALVSGGEATGGPPLGPSLGPIGVNVMAIVERINSLTKDYAGMKVPVEVIVDVDTKDFEVVVGTPTTAALIVKEIGVSKGASNPKEEKVGDLTREQVLKIADSKRGELLAKTLRSAVKEVVGCCTSMGVTVEGKDPREVQKEIAAGAWDEATAKDEKT